MAQTNDGSWHAWRIEEVLETSSRARDAILVKTGPRPVQVPAAFETCAIDPIAMPKAPTHTLRLVAVRPAPDAVWVELPRPV